MKKRKAALMLSLAFSAAFSVPASAATVKDLLQTGLEPMGQCVYVYGGGWNEADTGAGRECLTRGLSSRWAEFYNQNTAAYDWTKTKYQIHNGLDCTGYTGWVLYQLFGDSYSKSGYVFPSGQVAENYARLFGSEIIPPERITVRQSGDVMAKKGHVYIVLGQCADGSVVLMHASPPSVSLAGTVDRNRNDNSQAVRLAKAYMEKYFPTDAARYANYARVGRENYSYVTDFSEIRWKPAVLEDPDGYRMMTAEEILQDLFEGVSLRCGGSEIRGAYLQEGRAYLPLRAVCEALGYAVRWNPTEKKTEILMGEKTAAIGAGEGRIRGGKLYVSAQTLREKAGLTIRYDGETRTVTAEK